MEFVMVKINDDFKDIRNAELEKDMKEAFAFMKGRTKKLTRYVTTRYELPPAPKEVKSLRESLGLSQPKFASLVNMGVRSIQGWEQGLRRPDGSTSVLLWLLKEHPEVTQWLVERRQQTHSPKAPARTRPGSMAERSLAKH
jgi:DNA-binding transcriptional regulator YiaG